VVARETTPASRRDLERLRDEVARVAGAHVLSGLSGAALASGSISDLIHVNRVQGLALGFGGVARSGPLEWRPSIGYGTSDHRVTAAMALAVRAGPPTIGFEAARRVRDFSDLPGASGVLNTFLAQEGGHDYGDYVLLESARLSFDEPLGSASAVKLDGGVEHSQSVSTTAAPSSGHYRPNPSLGAGTYWVAHLGLSHSSRDPAAHRGLETRLDLEAGSGPAGYARAAAGGEWLAPLGPGEVSLRGYAGLGSDGLLAYRSFALGGRGTLLGEPFRAFGGRSLVWGHLEYRFDVPFPAISLGSFASTGHTITLAPFLAAGWTGRPIPGLPWAATDGIRPTAGLAAEWFMRLIRLEIGVALRGGGVGFAVDVNRDWWRVL
jgi:hypothetical protein